MKKIAIVDANSLWARSYFGAQTSNQDPFESAWRSWLAILNHCHPTHAVFCWDGKSKSNKPRKQKPQDFFILTPKLIKLLEELGVVSARSQDHEADDLIATYVKTKNPNDETIVVSGDKDMEQLMNDTTRIYNLNTKGFVSESTINKTWGVIRPSHVALIMAIVGDPGDGIQGIKGWGQVRAAKVYQHVKPEMSFEQAVEVILDNIPTQEQQTQFIESLEAVAVHPDAIQTAKSNPPSKIEWISRGKLANYGVHEYLYKWNLEGTLEQYKLLLDSIED